MLIGLDPGANTGVAIFRDGRLVDLHTIEPWDVPRLLAGHLPKRVVFEDSRLQSHTWTKVSNRAAAMKMARNVGQVDAWCNLITATCERLGIAAHGISPAGKGGKIKAEEFAAITGWASPSNEHQRDAAMVAWRYRGISK